MSRVGYHAEEPPLQADLPPGAKDYYALVEAEMERPATEIFLLEDGCVTVDFSTPWQYRFCFHRADGSEFDEIPQLYSLTATDEPIFVAGTTAVIEDRFTKFNVCHFLFDKMARALEFDGLRPDSYLIFSENGYVRDVMQRLDMRTFVSGGTAEQGRVSWRFERLLLSSSTLRYKHPGQNFKDGLLPLLSRLQATTRSKREASVATPRRLYLDRSSAQTRRVLNKMSFTDLLQRHGFTPVVLETLSFAEQVRLFERAEVILGVHGAGLSNAVFARSGEAMLLEILPPMCATSDYWKLAAAAGLRYDAFIADDPEHPRPDYAGWTHDPATYNRRDVVVDLARFEDFLVGCLDGAAPIAREAA